MPDGPPSEVFLVVHFPPVHQLTDAILLMETALVDLDKIHCRRYPLKQIQQAVGTMAATDRDKTIVNA